jgi:hypothetical protein
MKIEMIQKTVAVALLISISPMWGPSIALGQGGCNRKAEKAQFEPNYCSNGNQIWDEFILGSEMGWCGADRCQPGECFYEHNVTRRTTVHTLDDVYVGCVDAVIAFSSTAELNYTEAWDDPFSHCDVPEDCDNGGGPSD